MVTNVFGIIYWANRYLRIHNDINNSIYTNVSKLLVDCYH